MMGKRKGKISAHMELRVNGERDKKPVCYQIMISVPKRKGKVGDMD